MLKILLFFISIFSFCGTFAKDLFLKEIQGPDQCVPQQGEYLCSEEYIPPNKYLPFKFENPLSPSSHCERVYIFDLSSEFLNNKDFKKVKKFLKDSITNCFNKNIGEKVKFVSIDRISENYFFECSNSLDCNTVIDNINFEDLLAGDYWNGNELLVTDMEFVEEYSKNLSLCLRLLCACKYNSAVLFTNRIVDIKNSSNVNFAEIEDFYCIELSVILVGRNESNAQQLLEEYFGNISENLTFNIPDYECLHIFATCLLPCNTTMCGEIHYDYCTTDTTKPPSNATTISPLNFQHFTYILAFVDIARANFTGAMNSIVQSGQQISDYADNYKINVIISSTQVVTEIKTYYDFLYCIGNITIEDTKILAEYDKEFISRIRLAQYESPLTETPYIIILTDYYSIQFGQLYYLKNETIQSYDLHMFVYDVNVLASYSNYQIPCNYLQSYNNKIPLNFVRSTTTRRTTVGGISTSTSKAEDSTAVTYPSTFTTTESGNGNSNTETIIIIICCGVGAILLIVICLSIYFYRQHLRKQKIKEIELSHQKSQQIFDEWEMTWDQIIIKDEQLGSGAYGEVLQGKLSYLNESRKHLEDTINDIAIKMPQKFADENAKKTFLCEIKLMKSITGHNNIIKMIGCITVGERPCLILEFCVYRDLLQYVKNQQIGYSNLFKKLNQTLKEFLIFAWQISHGMSFLASEGVIHRDLAARNILIDGHKNAKIGDFGLCVQINDKLGNSPLKNSLILEAGKLPIKWLAYESLKNHEFSVQTDVWSFGMVLYEMYSFGEIPFADVDPSKLLDYLEDGNRPEKPELCSNEIYKIMTKCWQKDSTFRPKFDELITIFTVILENSTEGYGYLDLLRTEACLTSTH